MSKLGFNFARVRCERSFFLARFRITQFFNAYTSSEHIVSLNPSTILGFIKVVMSLGRAALGSISCRTQCSALINSNHDFIVLTLK